MIELVIWRVWIQNVCVCVCVSLYPTYTEANRSYIEANGLVTERGEDTIIGRTSLQ